MVGQMAYDISSDLTNHNIMTLVYAHRITFLSGYFGVATSRVRAVMLPGTAASIPFGWFPHLHQLLQLCAVSHLNRYRCLPCTEFPKQVVQISSERYVPT